MKKLRKTNYHIQQRNQHLRDILNESYYLELGTIDIHVLERIFNGELVSLNDIIFKDITIEGTGKILGTTDDEISLQLLYLDNLRSKSTSHKIFLTIGVLRYTMLEQEYYAPVVLVPVDIDMTNNTLIISGEPIQNNLVIYSIQAQYAFNITSLPKNASLYDVYSFLENITKITGFTYLLDNYLTVASIEYLKNDLNFDDLSIQRSIYEQTSFDVYKNYFYKIKAVKPTNIYQKWVLLKIANGESFIVDGNLGSGKTYTIINGMADAISPDKHKKVLFVSQDRNNIDEVAEELDNLHLSSYVYNLCRTDNKINEKKESFENIREEKIGLETLYPIVEYEEALNASIHRCRYAHIITELARIKNINPQIQTIPIDSYLESNEIKDVYQELVEIENILDIIEPLDINVWGNVEQYYSKQHTGEIVNATKNYLKLVSTFNKQIKQFCKTYFINLPNSFIESQRLFSYIETFTKLMPPSCWVSQFNQARINELLNSILIYQKKYGEIRRIVNSKVKEEYQINRIKELYNTICYKHLTIEDKKYLNNILNSNSNIKEILKVIDNSQKSIQESINKLQGICLFSTFDEEEIEYLRKLVGLLQNNKIHSSWINFYRDKLNIKTHFNEISALLEKFLSIKKYLSTFLIKEDSLTYRSLKQTTLSRDYTKQFLALFDRKALRKNKVSTDNIISSIFDLIDCGDKIKENVEKNDLFHTKNLDEFIVYYDNWINYINSLSKEEMVLFRRQISGSSRSITDSDQLLNIYNDYIASEKVLSKKYVELENYGITIEGINIVHKMKYAEEWRNYLSRVVQSNDELKETFIISYSLEDLVTIMNCDDEYNSLQEILNTRDREMKHYLGSTYKRLDTDCSLIQVLVRHFSHFLTHLKTKDTIKLLYDNDLMENLVEDFIKLNELLEQRLQAHNKFSKYFTGGLNKLLECSLDESYKQMIRFDEHTSEIKPIFTIFDYAHHFEKLGLINLSEGILSSKYKKGISNMYIYSTYLEYKNELINEKPILAENNNILTWLENYKYFENNNCMTNLRELERRQPNIDKRTFNHVASIPFNDYDKIIQSLINQKSIFLADLNIFNSQIDLSKFDIIFVDDVQLSSAFKYSHLDEAKQIVMFGDSTSQNLRSSNIFSQVPEKNIFTLVECYTKDNPGFGNTVNHKNQYVLDYSKSSFLKQFNTLADQVEMIVKNHLQNPDKLIDILVSSPNYKLEVYKELVKGILRKDPSANLKEILDKKIRIIRAPYERCKIVNDIYVLYDDLYELGEEYIRHILDNYTTGCQNVYIYHTPNTNIQMIKDFLKQASELEKPQTKDMPKLTRIIYNELTSRGFTVESGPGHIDLMIRGKVSKNKVVVPNVGIIIEGLDGKSSYAILDDYDYYYNEYKKEGWEIYIFCVNDIIDNLQDKLDVISSFLAQKDTKSMHQLKIDDYIK